MTKTVWRILVELGMLGLVIIGLSALIMGGTLLVAALLGVLR